LSYDLLIAPGFPMRQAQQDSRRRTCPECGGKLQLEDRSGPLRCSSCGKRYRISTRFAVVGFLLSFFASLIISQMMGLQAYAAIFWIPIFVACLILSRDIVPLLVKPLEPFTDSPRRRSALRENLNLYFAVWVGLTLTMVCYIYLLAWLAFLTGRSHGDAAEVADMASYPLAWIDSRFSIRENKTFPVVLAIVAGNSLFYAAGLLASFKVVRRAARRNRIIELSIGGTKVEDDDDDSL
jgi:hypothetical protein